MSSRQSGDDVRRLPFIPVTLLPFTETQQRQFFDQWFAENPRHVRTIELHLQENGKLREALQNPLLATVLCTLMERNSRLPQNEVGLYVERFRLLLDSYDAHKGTQRVRSSYVELVRCAKGIAFKLHCESKREERRAVLYTMAIDVLGRDREESARLAVDELEDPCNVLVPMTDDGKLGFGHLRYQEYLAATVLCEDRSVPLHLHIGNPRWSDVYMLMAQLVRDLEGCISVLAKEGYVAPAKDVVLKMIEARPELEWNHLRDVLDDAIAAERQDDLIAFSDGDQWDLLASPPGEDADDEDADDEDGGTG